MGLVWGLMTTGMNAIIFWMPLILDATLNSDEALAAASAQARGLERAAETSVHHDQRVMMLRPLKADPASVSAGSRRQLCHARRVEEAERSFR